MYRQLSKKQRADEEQIKRTLITAYATDRFNAFNQFIARRLCPEETVEFLTDMHRLTNLLLFCTPSIYCLFMGQYVYVLAVGTCLCIHSL